MADIFSVHAHSVDQENAKEWQSRQKQPPTPPYLTNLSISPPLMLCVKC